MIDTTLEARASSIFEFRSLFFLTGGRGGSTDTMKPTRNPRTVRIVRSGEN